MKPEIKHIHTKTLVGLNLYTHQLENKTFELWKNFKTTLYKNNPNMQHNFYSVEVYDASLDFQQFTPETKFTKWAAVLKSDITVVPEGMEEITIPEGLYAVFTHKGDFAQFGKTMQYIFGVWLPNSEYILDNRPHIAIMGEKYINNHPDSEEDIYVPVRLK